MSDSIRHVSEPVRATNGAGVKPIVRAVGQPARPTVDVREQQLFQSLDLDNDGQILRSEFEAVLAGTGLSVDDSRLTESMSMLDAVEKLTGKEASVESESTISRDQFCSAIRQNILLIERALQGRLVVPDFVEFCSEVDCIYRSSRENRSGAPADYIPQLALDEAAADQYGVALCTIDGQRHAVGDAQSYFSVQSTCKPISYCLALEEHGVERVHHHVGHEPSGVSFNELILDRLNRPHNPLINAGAIMTSSLIRLKEKQQKIQQGRLSELDARAWAGSRLEHVIECWQALCGGATPRASIPMYLSERQTADRNFALGYYMREKGVFPDDIDLADVLDFYFQCCAIELNTELLSVVAATLANGGVCPVTGERVFSTDTVRRCLAMMSSCGMYDFSGEFAFTIGLPAKSGVSGAILIVVPNVMGICTWSPRLDLNGNSVRGIEFCRQLVATFNFHNYDHLTGVSAKQDPRHSRIANRAAQVNQLIWAASKGDQGAIEQQCAHGARLDCPDYDGRTALHLACAEGQLDVVRFFVSQQQSGEGAPTLNPRDRWGGTPLDDAYMRGHQSIIDALEQAGAVRGREDSFDRSDNIAVLPQQHAYSAATNELIWAASIGDLAAICRLVARGTPLEVADYDQRTPLHLAAAQGHLDVVRYFIAHEVEPNPSDRWGNTPLDDALRHGGTAVVELLKQRGGRQGGNNATTADRQLSQGASTQLR